MAYPFLENLRLSFFSWDGLSPAKWTGSANYLRALQDPVFYKSLWHTVAFSILHTCGTVSIGFFVAVGISRRVWGWRLFRFCYFIPVMMAVTVVGALWIRLFEYNIGLINVVLGKAGLNPVPWLSDIRFSLLSIIIVATWQYVGFPMIVILAGLENIPQHIQDAATIDGVNEIQRMIRITLPLLRPVMISITMLQFVLSLRVFDIVYVMTKGGPSNSSEVLVSYLYKKGFQSYQFGFASSIAVLMFFLVFAVGYWYQRAINREQVQY